MMKGKTYLLKVAYLCIVLFFLIIIIIVIIIHEIKAYTWQMWLFWCVNKAEFISKTSIKRLSSEIDLIYRLIVYVFTLFK